MAYTLSINGAQQTVDVDGDTPLLWVLRDVLELTGTKFGCGITPVRRLHGPRRRQHGAVMHHVDQLLQAVPKPTDDDIDKAMTGNICRCATYVRIRAAIHTAAKSLGG